MPNRAPVRCLWVAAMLALLATTTTDAAPPPDRLPSISERTRSMQHLPGFLTLHSDAVSGKLYLEIRRLGEDLLYVDSLPYGSGSNDLGLDRGELSDSRIVRFERFGTKILLVQPNGRFRSSSASPAEQLTVRQSFAESVLAGFSIEAQDPGEAGAGGAVLVDATEFFERDAHDVAEALARNQKEGYKLDPARCAIALDATKSFPKNTEVETLLTFVAPHLEPGGYVRDVAPDPHALTIRQRQSFVELQGVERNRFAPPQAQIAQVQVAVGASDEATVGASVQPGVKPVERLVHRALPRIDGIRRQAGFERRLNVAGQTPSHVRMGVRQRRQGLVIGGDRVGDGIQQRGVEAPLRRDRGQEIGGRDAGHAEDPVHDGARGVQSQGAVGLAHDGNDLAIQAGGGMGIEGEFPLAEAAAVLDPGEIQERQVHRFLQLPHRVGAEEDQRDMRLDRIGARELAEERDGFGLVATSAGFVLSCHPRACPEDPRLLCAFHRQAWVLGLRRG